MEEKIHLVGRIQAVGEKKFPPTKSKLFCGKEYDPKNPDHVMVSWAYSSIPKTRVLVFKGNIEQGYLSSLNTLTVCEKCEYLHDMWNLAESI